MDAKTIGQTIAALRRKSGMTQSALAERLHISDKTVSKWESGYGMPELSLMQPVCKVLKTDLNELFSGERLTG